MNLSKRPRLLQALRGKATLIAIGSTLTSLLGINAPTLAEPFLQESGIFLPDLLPDLVHNAYQDLSNVVNEWIADTQDADLAPALQGMVNNALGVLGFPAPAELSRTLEEELLARPQADITEVAPGATTAAIKRALNRGMLYQQIEAVWGKDGQALTRDKAKAARGMVEENFQLAVTAQQAVSTQEALKSIAQQQARSSMLLSTLQTELLQNRQDAAAQSLALINVSESLDQQLSNRQVERRSEVYNDLEQAALARLF